VGEIVGLRTKLCKLLLHIRNYEIPGLIIPRFKSTRSY
jgi:hypothetical protein